MRQCYLAIGVVLASVLPAGAADPPLMCFGNEPSWGLALDTPGTARLMLPDVPPAEYRGTETRIAPLPERAWRGTPSRGGGADLVAFLRDTECSDGMSDLKHPVVARVSLPDGRFLAGCCRLLSSAAPVPPAAGAPPSTASVAIEGPVWRLIRLRGQDEQALAGLPTGITVRFEAGQLQGFDGCNQLVGSYTIDRDRVTLGPLAGTMMACAPPVMAIETAFRDAFTGALRFSVAQGRLTLVAASDTDPALVFAAAPPPRLAGVTWEVTGFNNGRQAVVSPLTGTTLTVSFQEGSVVGHAGCNSFRATYTREGNRLAVGPAATTRRSCGGEGIMEQERQFLDALASATTWAIDRDMLDLHRADGERVLLARPSVK
jgi:heat shock protein HslJ